MNKKGREDEEKNKKLLLYGLSGIVFSWIVMGIASYLGIELWNPVEWMIQWF